MEWSCAPCQQAQLTMVLGAILARGRDVCRRNGLLILSVLSVIVGCLLGFFLRTRRLSPQEISYFQFPGELLMRMLKMLILPLVVSSLMSGLASLDAKTSSRLGILTVAYYLWTTFLAVVVGIIMVTIIHPGGAAQKETMEQSGKPVMSSADALLDLIRLIKTPQRLSNDLALPSLLPSQELDGALRSYAAEGTSPTLGLRNMFPANLVEATFKQYRTKTTPVVRSPKVTPEEAPPRHILIYGVQEENGSRVQNFALDLTPPPEIVYKSEPDTSDGMNVLGIVIFSATMGIVLGRMGASGGPLVSFCQCLNESVMKIVAVAVWYFPFGIVFLIAGKILEMDDPKVVGKQLGLYAITVVCGLVIHGLFILPLLYFFITKKNPIVFIRGVLQALLIALATSSSSATLPITFKCLLENNHIDRRIARFVLPVGATINMDGTALYEAVAAIFIAQVNNSELDFGQIITIRDRFRTMINVLGDALAAGIMAHICRKDFAWDPGTEKLPPSETKPVSLQEIVASQQNGCVKSVAEASELTLGPACPHHIPVQEQVGRDEELATASLDHCTIEIRELETNV
ncbi:excitatory amino acid transporter 5 isoform X5 [Heterocephalus glaber]|uniref:Amino acid transporter n=1 Tax=Heterocephalus glaber TaxID=10181 RepID=A0AAX6S6I9_HETGA|nr:excitatory amino acid transporter 5 isoform X5 [Heterocephalus glaber]